ncbi:MAG: hypothetical protein IKQ17_06305 [Kiritimatiellae bacterium]|nr:hypothetical protein [Kiritimatiellia bacterium]
MKNRFDIVAFGEDLMDCSVTIARPSKNLSIVSHYGMVQKPKINIRLLAVMERRK